MMKQNNFIKIFILTVAFAIIGVNTSRAQDKKYTFKDVLVDNTLISRIICKYNDDGSSFSLYMLKEYTYDEQNRIKTQCISHWNGERQCWYKALFYIYSYDGELYSIELLKYNRGENKSIQKRLRSTYSVDDDLNLLSGQNYEWNKKNKGWVLINKFVMINNMPLSSIMR